MKIAVIGRGSAGSLAAAYVSQHHPDHELFHIYDPATPIVGVGEGTLPGLPMLLSSITRLAPSSIESRLNATRKFGIRFENWGTANPVFMHHFTPPGRKFGYHLSADGLVDLLGEYVTATHIDDRVTSIVRRGRAARIDFEHRDPLSCDLVIDARGFPRELDPDEHVEVPFIPTNCAVVRRGAPSDYIYATRAVARPHGWVFVIPLTSHTSYGYVFNRNISGVDDVTDDFDEFLAGENVADVDERGVIGFHNFFCRQMYDGVVARVGNAGGFMEPLEATALAMIHRQIVIIVKNRLTRPTELAAHDAETINRHLLNWTWGYGLFIAWHYSRGARYDSEFWRFARAECWPRCFDADEVGVDCRSQLRRLNQFVDGARTAPRDEAPESSYSGFPMESFVDMARGLG